MFLYNNMRRMDSYKDLDVYSKDYSEIVLRIIYTRPAVGDVEKYQQTTNLFNGTTEIEVLIRRSELRRFELRSSELRRSESYGGPNYRGPNVTEVRILSI